MIENCRNKFGQTASRIYIGLHRLYEAYGFNPEELVTATPVFSISLCIARFSPTEKENIHNLYQAFEPIMRLYFNMSINISLK